MKAEKEGMFDEHGWVHDLASWAALMGSAILGRLMYVLRQVQRGNRRFFSIDTAFDMVIALTMGIIAYGACTWFGLTGAPAAGLIAVAGYLGPHAIDTFFEKWASEKAGK